MLLQAALEASESIASDNRLLTIIGESDIIIQSILVILLGFSVVSWAIVFMKWSQLGQVRKRVAEFSQAFSAAQSVESFIKTGAYPKGPALSIFQAGLGPLRKEHSGSAADVERGTLRSMNDEMTALESYVPFLAITASATPFIGLLGTVWGILNAFWEISSAGSSSLQVVGPSIAEALFVTAVGLVAAIPALIFYNVLNNKIRVIARAMEQLSADITVRVTQEYCQAA